MARVSADIKTFQAKKATRSRSCKICIPWTLCVYVYVIHINLFLQSRRLRLDTSPQPSQRGLFAFLFMQSPTWLGHDVLNGSSQLAHSYTKHGRLRISSSSDLVNR